MVDSNERLAVVETEIEEMRDDIKEIKKDVKALGKYKTYLSGVVTGVTFFWGIAVVAWKYFSGGN